MSIASPVPWYVYAQMGKEMGDSRLRDKQEKNGKLNCAFHQLRSKLPKRVRVLSSCSARQVESALPKLIKYCLTSCIAYPTSNTQLCTHHRIWKLLVNAAVLSGSH